MITEICLVRHGETDWNIEGRLQGQEDIPMNETGRRQASAIAAFLGRTKWDAVVSSPLGRAYETAKIIADSIEIPDIDIIDDFKERSYGMAAGLLPQERRELYPSGIPGQEDFEHLRCRAIAAFDHIVIKYPGKRVIIVSHGGLINTILYTLSNGEFGSFKTRLYNGCISLIRITDSGREVLYYNKLPEDL